jgi:NTP pyrophosphatase (non-canonical NTP hydrolase)
MSNDAFRVALDRSSKLNAPATDESATLSQLRHMVREFVSERQWSMFHSPKNLSMSLAIEAAELMEHFQWLTTDASRENNKEKLIQIGEELADVFCYTLAMANELEIDLTAAFVRKMSLNAQKYPVQEYRGRYGPEDTGDRQA